MYKTLKFYPYKPKLSKTNVNTAQIYRENPWKFTFWGFSAKMAVLEWKIHFDFVRQSLSKVFWPENFGKNVEFDILKIEFRIQTTQFFFQVTSYSKIMFRNLFVTNFPIFLGH